MQNESKAIDQVITINGRRFITIDKVSHIVRFDEEILVIETECGRIVIDGEELKVMSLDKDHAKINLEGKIHGVFYSDERQLKRGSGKLFK